MDTYQTPCSKKPDKWFSQDPINVSECLTACRTSCPIRQECLRMSLEAGETHLDSGIWGGELPDTRRQMLEPSTQEPEPADDSEPRDAPTHMGAGGLAPAPKKLSMAGAA